MNSAPTLALPALQQAELDDATVAQLFSDVAQFAGILAVIPRAATRTLAPPPAMGLDEARAALLAGTIRGVQLRYRYDGREWTDTLLSAGPGRTRLVRISAEDVAASVAATR